MKKRVVGGVPVLTIVGLLSALSFSYMAYISLLDPLLATVTFVGIVTVGVIVLVLVIYYASITYHKRRGLDISLAFKDIPQSGAEPHNNKVGAGDGN